MNAYSALGGEHTDINCETFGTTMMFSVNYSLLVKQLIVARTVLCKVLFIF